MVNEISKRSIHIEYVSSAWQPFEIDMCDNCRRELREKNQSSRSGLLPKQIERRCGVMEQTELKKFYFTFGCGQNNAGYCQPVYAKDYETARKRMFGIHGENGHFSTQKNNGRKTKQEQFNVFILLKKK